MGVLSIGNERRVDMAKRGLEVLTPPQEETLRIIGDYIDLHGYPPTARDLAATFGIKYASALDRIKSLVKKGYITRNPRLSRSIRIIRRVNAPRSRLVAFPLIGTIAAGTPVLAEENREGIIMLECTLPDTENCFALRARGESMIEAGIKDGDILVVRQQFLANNGEMIVACVNGETTVKMLHYEHNKIELVPKNKTMKPIPISGMDDFRIQGVVQFWRSPN